MANFFPAQAKVSPSFSEPDLIVTYAQASGAFAALADGAPRVKLGNDDLYVYVNSLDLRSEAQAAQAAGNLLPSASLVGNYYSTPTYLIRTRAVWNHHDTAAAANYAIALPAAQDLAQRQGIFQQIRTGLLYGFNPANGEGLLNAPGATAVTLPADTFGNTTVSAYDGGQMALFILQQIVALKASMFQSGGNITSKIKVVGPQRIFLLLAYANIVQVTSYQRPGAGTATTADVIARVAGDSGDTFEWFFDDTLIGKGANGSDAVILTIPEIEQPDIPGINTNIFGGVKPNMKAVNVQYADMPAPMKIPTPIPDGGITEVQEMRITSGWNVRGSGIYILNMPH